ncbi:MAG: hypothetical protein HOM68_28045 [Gemmatimonadetes bacterium]|nr:hypothetical protein [Gemmatimonadota bacterium]MBT5590780.1 hypothetical protein [Gemmatimonadota bacterium]
MAKAMVDEEIVRHQLKTLLPAALILVFALATVAQAQTLRLREVGTGQTRIVAQVGQTIEIEVLADLQGVSSAGSSFFISIPDREFFEVRDFGIPGVAGVQPFRQGPLFAGGVEVSNSVLPESDPVAAQLNGQQLDYGAVIGLGGDRERTGTGVIATFSLLCLKPIENGALDIDDNPIRETRLVLSDGVSEARYRTTQGMEITVTGIELRDIPDVILTPGQSDSVQIGSLNDYVLNTLASVDDITWSFEPAEPESLSIEIRPESNRVVIIPVEGWRGLQRIKWTATEPPRIAGRAPLTATEFSDIVVNNPPVFDIEADSLGVKRDTVRILEDRFVYARGTLNPSITRAFRGIDLDLLVIDPDVDDPDQQLRYAVTSSTQPVTQANVRGTDDEATHDLLVWSATDFGGIDSLKVRVQDLQGAEDSLRVIVLVEEVPDAPRFLLTGDSEINPRISRGGTKSYRWDEFVEDPDTPLDSLILRWSDDPEEHFRVDTTRVAGDLMINVIGDPTFAGTGRIRFFVDDPVDPVNLNDTVTLFFVSSEALPPEVFPSQTKIDLPRNGSQMESLDEFVEDPDNDDAELRWSLPGVTQNALGVDEQRILTVIAQQDFVGYEEINLTVSDPGDQSDQLTLRIYVSDGRPVVGGIPDLILDLSDEDRSLDLDNYYYDDNNTDVQMDWRALSTFNEDNLRVSIDPLTHIVTFLVDQNAEFGNEVVIFQVQDPSGISAQDTMLVTIRSGGVGAGGAFSLTPLPDLEAPVGQLVTVADLLDHLLVSPSVSKGSVRFEVADPGQLGAAIIQRRTDASDEDGFRQDLSVFSETSGLDTIRISAIDSLGRSEVATTTIRYFGESERLDLRSLPDIVFIAGQSSQTIVLNDFIVDRIAHPDSVIQWAFSDIGSGEGAILIQINNNSSVFALSGDITETEVVFVARDTALNVSGRDTVRIISQDPDLATQPLEPFPDLVLEAGDIDSSIVLNDFLPQGVSPATTNWSVSGQRLTAPVIDPVSPHLLRVTALGNSLGADTLSLRVDLGGGFLASGELIVNVVEPINDSTMEMRVVPNPINPQYLNFFVIARTELASSPTVVVTFEGDSTVAVSQVEEDLNSGVLIWGGAYRVRQDATGTVTLRATALTALGSSVNAQESIAVGQLSAGKVMALRHGPVEVVADPAYGTSTTVTLQSRRPERDGSARIVGVTGARESELIPTLLFNLLPAHAQLAAPAQVAIDGVADGLGLYRSLGPDRWQWIGRLHKADAHAATAEIAQFGQYQVAADFTIPQIKILQRSPGRLQVQMTDGGSGIDPVSIEARLHGELLPVTIDDDVIVFELSSASVDRMSSPVVEIRVQDQASNKSTLFVEIDADQILPRHARLGENFPNPFNPETTIPFAVPGPGLVSEKSRVRLVIYNTAGQRVRLLLDEGMQPGIHQILWDGRDAMGRTVGSGTYFYRLTLLPSGIQQTRPMTLLK